MAVSDFFSQYAPYAQSVSRSTGIDPRIVLAQAALETGYGRSAPNYNLFGIKGKGSTQQTKEFVDGKMVSMPQEFRAYRSPEESFQDYAKLMSGKRYEGVRSGRTLEEQIAALQKSGYATDPEYGQKIMQIAKGINLEGLPMNGPTQQQSQGLLGSLLGGQGIGGALGLSEDFRDRLAMGIMAGSDPRQFAPLIEQRAASMKERKAEKKLQGQVNKTVEWLKSQDRADLANAVMTGAIDPASAINAALTKSKDQRTALMKEYELAKTDPEFAKLLGLKTAPKTSEGLKTLDTEFAKSLGQGGGAQSVSAALQDLAAVQTVLNKLEAGEPLTGPIIGSLPETVRAFISPEGVQAQQLVESVVQKNLRAILGGQFAQKEGEQLVKRAYNPQLPPEQNAARLRALGETLKAAAENKLAMTEYFFANNYSLEGYGGPVGVPSLSVFMSALEDVPSAQGGSQQGQISDKNAQNKLKFPNAPDIGTVSQGYVYNGGDPSDPKSWSAQ